MERSYFVHPSADVSPQAIIGEGTKIWQHCQVREKAVLGMNCILSKGVYIDAGVVIGKNVKIQNGISVYHGVTLQDGVFCGPHCVFTNDKRPRSINPDGTLKGGADWVVSETLVKEGASIGAHATIVCGITIGKWAMIGSGAVVTKSVPDYGLVYGNPARLHGFVCPCGQKLSLSDESLHLMKTGTNEQPVKMICPDCSSTVEILWADYNKLETRLVKEI
jgi:acetyltransferase-like isoleucine patch superfamily enzyme